jgi:hypothetical protein
VIMFDAISDTAYPADAEACAAYIDGHLGDQPNYEQVKAEHPGAHMLSVALDPADDADCLDVERGAAAPGDFPAWYTRQVARGVDRPAAYASVSVMASALLPILIGTGITRARVRLWSSHYQAGAHICGPRTCGLIILNVDGTQWLPGPPVDQSLLLNTFFGPLPWPPLQKWQVEMMRALPLVHLGQTGPDVLTVQSLCNARLRPDELNLDGVFGPATAAAVKRVQAGHVAQDGIVGPETWPVLLNIA